jgi:outer membrane protein TolC
LGAALRRADSAAYGNRIADATADARAAAALLPLQGVLPGVRVEAGWGRTTDPLAAFGYVLRQRAVTPAAFDPATLNAPGGRSNVAGGLVLEQPILNPEAWAGRAAAGREAAAARAAADWFRASTRTAVVRAYWGAVFAREAVATLETALATAQQHVREAEAMARNGMVTRSDVLLAQVRAGGVEARLVAARSEALLAVQRLADLLGADDAPWTLPPALPPAARLRGAVAADTAAEPATAERADVRAAQSGLGAADAGVRRAAARWLPRVSGFGRLDWNAPSALFAGRASWTVGVMAQWSPFTGASELAELRAARARAAGAAAALEGTRRQASLEVAQADAALAVASVQLDIAERAIAQAAEAHRIVTRRYDGGLASVVELFDAHAAETEARLAQTGAQYQLLTAFAARRQAHGLDLDPLIALDPPESRP